MATASSSPSFKDKVVLVTGGSNGIGAATVSLFLEQGAKVVSLDIREFEAESHPNRFDIKCNVAFDAEVRAAVQQTVDKYGTIDVLCNVAGITDYLARVAETSDEELSKIMGIDFYGPFYMMRAVIPHFLSKPESTSTRGSIVNVCSIAAVSGGCNGASYTAAKHALLGLTRNTAVGYAKQGIKCNAVLPGPTITDIAARSNAEVLHPEGGPAITGTYKPFLGFARPEYIARAIIFLAGAEGANGAELAIDNAFLVR